jgi:hypothetical protein
MLAKGLLHFTAATTGNPLTGSVAKVQLDCNSGSFCYRKSLTRL